VEAAAVENLSPEEESKALVRGEYERLVAQSDFFGWTLRLVDGGDFYVIFVRIVGAGGRTFVLKLECDDYWQIAPLSGFIKPELLETADEDTAFDRESYPSGSEIHPDRGPLPVMCIKGHRDYYAGNWHSGWSIPPAHDHTLYQHVVNVRNALLDKWT
jgi:hypothetical protein